MAKKTRKELLKKEDAFQVAAGQSAQWLADNKVLAIGATLGVLALVAAVWGGAEYIRYRNTESSTLLEAAFELQAAQVIVETEDTKADPTSALPTFASETDRDQAVIAKFEEVVQAAGGSGVGDLAHFSIADILEKSGDTDGARAIFATLVDDLSAADSLYFVAIERLAYLQEAKGETDAAIETLSRLIGSERFYADFATFHQARLYLSKGETDRAKNLFERVQTEYPNSPVKDEADKQLEKLETSQTPSGEQAAAAPAPVDKGTVDVAADPTEPQDGDIKENVAAAENTP